MLGRRKEEDMSDHPESEVFERIGNYYDKLVNKYGRMPEACDYGRAVSQLIKFRVLSDVLSMSGMSMLDVGCGFADYYDFLKQKYGDFTYRGVDLSRTMIQQAKEIHPHLDLRHGNVLNEQGEDKYDIVNANGIFYLLGDMAMETMQLIIDKMFRLSRNACVFNSLSAWAPSKESGEFYADPCQTMAYCRTLTPWVVLRHDYHPRDFTVYLYKAQQK